MIYVEFILSFRLQLLCAASAFRLLREVQPVHVVNGKRSAILSNLCAPSVLVAALIVAYRYPIGQDIDALPDFYFFAVSLYVLAAPLIKFISILKIVCELCSGKAFFVFFSIDALILDAIRC